MDKTHSYTYFSIGSNGIIDVRGLVGNDKGLFDPDEITRMLGIEPFKKWKKGDFRQNGSEYLFSSWAAEKSEKDRLDVEQQCLDTIKKLKEKVTILQTIKSMYDVHFCLTIVPQIYGEEAPIMSFNNEIIEFCYLTGTTIQVDMYVYQD